MSPFRFAFAIRLPTHRLLVMRAIYRRFTCRTSFEPTRRSWIDTPGRGGILLNTGVHAFDLLRFLTVGHIDWTVLVHVVYLATMGIAGLIVVSKRLDKLLLK